VRATGLHAIARAETPAAWALAVVPPVIFLILFMAPYWAVADPLDYHSYVLGTNAILGCRSPYPAFELAGPFDLQQAAGRGYVYPPSAAIVTAPFVASRELWSGVNLLVLAGGCLAILRRYALLRPFPVLLVLWAIVIHPGTIESLSIGTVSPAVAGLVGFAVTSAAGPVAGIGAALKLYPGAWFAMGLRRRSPREWLGFAVGLLVPVGVSVAFAGVGPWLDYLRVFGNAQPSCNGLASAACAGIPSVALDAIAAGLLLVAAWTSLPTSMAAVVAAVLVLAPDIWYHYLLLLIPLGVAVACSTVTKRQERLAGAPQASTVAS
jgi:hypothetical protein